MSIYNEVKKAVSTTVDIIVDKTTTQAQKSRLVTVMRNEEKIANQAYLELGKYLYNNLRDGMPENVADLCTKIDESKERMSRAQKIYREVIQQELVNHEINKTEAKENLQKIKDPIVSKAKDTAQKVKSSAADKAYKVKGTALDTAHKVNEKAGELKHKASKSDDVSAKSDIAENVDPAEIEERTLPNDIVKPIDVKNISTDTNEVLTVGQGLEENLEVIENAIFSDTSANEAGSMPDSEAEAASNDIFSSSAKEDEGEVGESLIPDANTVDQDFQRNMPVDIISENEFEEDEPEVKPVVKNTHFTKAMKLKRIIKKKNPEEK